VKKKRKKQKVRGKILKKLVKEKKCYFCGTTENLTEHHIVFKKVISFLKQLGVAVKTDKVYLCGDCHKKYHILANPVVDLLLMVIQQLVKNLQPKKPHKVGFIWKNGKRVGKGGKKK